MPDATELRELEDDELEGRLSEYRRELLNLRFQLATGQLDNVARLVRCPQDIARVMTVLRDREIALAEGRDAGPVVLARPRPTPRRVREQQAAEQAEAEAEAGPAEDEAGIEFADELDDGALDDGAPDDAAPVEESEEDE